MIISRRRFYWAIVLTLLFALCVLVRPMRTWIDRGLVATATGGSVAVDRLHLHFGESVIEAQGLAIERNEGARHFGLRAAKTWVAVDGVGVIDRRCAAQTVLVEDAVLYLDGDQAIVATPPAVSWFENLSQRMSGISWADLQQHFGSILSADNLATHWEQKVAKLVRDSADVLTQLNQIESETANMDNPLRYEVAVRDRLQRLEQLQAEQEDIMKKFAAARQQLEAEAKQLRSKFDAEKESFAFTAIDGDMSMMANEILDSSGRTAWQQIASYCEIAARMASVNSSDTSLPWNKNFRNLNGPLIDLPVVKVAGMFERGPELVPFSVEGAFISSTGEDIAESNWDYSFFQLQRIVELGVVATDNETQSISIDAHLDGDESDQNQTVASGEIRVAGEELSGEVLVYASAFEYNSVASDHSVGREQQILSSALSRQGSDACIAFTVSGTWEAPSLTASQPAQDWLIDQIHESIQPSLQQAIAQATTQMETELHTRLAKIETAARTAAQGADAIVNEHRNPLYAARNRLQASLDELSGASIRR
ncbi:MAG: hypothetical protein Aurels2KO_44510 [Aureliella sp.]